MRKRTGSGAIPIQKLNYLTPRPLATLLSEVENPVIYVLRSHGLIKIGYTINLRRRLQEYASNGAIDSIDNLLMLKSGTLEEEQQILTRWREQLFRGREWFLPTAEMLDWINSERALMNVVPLKRGKAASAPL